METVIKTLLQREAELIRLLKADEVYLNESNEGIQNLKSAIEYKNKALIEISNALQILRNTNE